MIKIKVNGTIDLNLVNKLVRENPNQHLCLVIDNTKNQYPERLEEVARSYDNIVTISVTGGLTPQKKKFDNELYQKRTYHTPFELSKIIRIFQSIERGINLSWNETEKAMWVYNSLCNRMVYEKLELYGRDMCRSLSGLLYGKAVCSGFALILKEALDRIGIECYYQNQESSHSWVIAKLDGAYRALELTWDCYNKGNKGCTFRCFNRDPKFYQDEHHNLKYEKEEHEFPIVPYTVDQLNNFVDRINKKIMDIPLSQDRVVNLSGIGRLLEIKGGKVTFVNPNIKRFVRRDGSIFYLVHTGYYKGVNKFYYFFMKDGKIRGTTIYSESRLDQLPQEYSYDIADGLLSKERIKRKINQFNGYVGYIGQNRGIYYDDNFERRELNVVR